VGSTSVPGFAAKPVIDILLVIADPAEEPRTSPSLGRTGYRLVAGHPGWYQHRMLKGPDTGPASDSPLAYYDDLRCSEACGPAQDLPVLSTGTALITDVVNDDATLGP
jgi:hypothetical protein